MELPALSLPNMKSTTKVPTLALCLLQPHTKEVFQASKEAVQASKEASLVKHVPTSAVEGYGLFCPLGGVTISPKHSYTWEEVHCKKHQNMAPSLYYDFLLGLD